MKTISKESAKNNHSLTLYIKGGLGNQLFQYATAYSYAKKFNKELIVNIDSYSGYIWNKDGGLAINQIIKNIQISPLANWTIFMKGSIMSTFIGRVSRKLLWQKGQVFKEKKLFIYDNELMKNGSYDGVYGSFQSPLYFNDQQNEIRKLFNLPISTITAKDFKQIINKTPCSVAIHYRDYGTGAGSTEVKKLFGDLSDKYYKDAIAILNKRLNNPKYFIFSNNIAAAKEKFINIIGVTFFDYQSELKWEDMALMAECDHNIICNSSYSWWSAYLNKNKDKIVIAPKTWGNLLKGREIDNDLFPNEWITI
ncbi:MAG: alpha-1,2-fucosyltransferase [Candidatus Cloacimonetes bacterium]|nr:alpha-1,2-fucosyltransferase [Candidatus Cloacimonadota bacterium]